MIIMDVQIIYKYSTYQAHKVSLLGRCVRNCTATLAGTHELVPATGRMRHTAKSLIA